MDELLTCKNGHQGSIIWYTEAGCPDCVIDRVNETTGITDYHKGRKENAMPDVDDYLPSAIAIAHANYLSNKIAERCEKKYLKGDREHRGDLSRKMTLPHALDEALDLPIYLITLEDNIDETVIRLKIAEEKLGGTVKDLAENQAYYTIAHAVQAGLNAVTQALNILTIGNPEGVPEEER